MMTLLVTVDYPDFGINTLPRRRDSTSQCHFCSRPRNIHFFSWLLWLVLFVVVETTWWCQEMPTATKPLSFLASFFKGLSLDFLEYHSTPPRQKNHLHYFLDPYITYVNDGVSHPIK